MVLFCSDVLIAIVGHLTKKEEMLRAKNSFLRKLYVGGIAIELKLNQRFDPRPVQFDTAANIHWLL